MKNASWFPKFLLAAYLVVFVWLGWEPYDRAVWYAENGPIFAIAAYLTFLYFRGVQFSNFSYAMMAVLLFVHTVGGHYTFERVPFDWFNNFFGFERNMYDRVGHFSVGFYAFAIAEYIQKKAVANTKWVTYLLPFFFIMALAAAYELFEWWYAVTFGGSAGVAFLGSQGDVWDAQKDILMDTLGAVFALGVYFWRECATIKGPRNASGFSGDIN